ncbi:hypothetical protein RhiirA1_469152 [Rhizophagus irregularis]|uniref:F-box domain-containing protein n=1 Tax=Rhizophagus irregularis TaxID=588596 RepID=A0A2N0R8K0_9GLOM|nr:hypothetical protein RhiirA1_469152 [Rhizophagus irregularis]GBC47796.2 hypothetical protein GLOIN_2v1882637 [Rhizophagus irregularis DAOM 181602=DAOM 197198]
MACSKLFSGDLPELMNEVIQYFHYDHKTLHSCILVNRLWCRLAIPLLWEDPFSIKDPKNYHFIEIYLHYLNDDDKTKLNEYVIHNELFPSNALFNYPSFIQHLSSFKICCSIEKWITTVGTSTTSNEQHSRYFTRKTNLQIPISTKLIYKLLFLIFIENGANLHSFEVTFIRKIEIDYFNEIFELILQNPNFIYNIKNFKIDFHEITDNIMEFLRNIYSNCKSISSLDFQFPSCNFNYSVIEKSLSQLIKSQENLQKILFGYNDSPLHHSLLSLKYSDCSNTLNTIIFYHVDFKNIVVLNEAFNQLNALESIHIVYCYSLDSNFVQQISNVTKPFKLKSLFMRGILQIESLKLLMQKFGNYIENIGITNKESQQLLQLIIKYCSNIKYLVTTWLDTTKRQILPFKLKYLNLILMISNTINLEIFLKNLQNTFIKRLLIKNVIVKEENEDIFPYIKEYIMKTKRVEYLAILENIDGKYEDLFFQKEKVKVFQLHGIKVLNYSDLVINVYDFIKEIC